MVITPTLKETLLRRIRGASTRRIPVPAELSSRLSPQAHFRAVLFDVYGTLLTSTAGDVGTSLHTAEPREVELALKSAGFQLTPNVGRKVLDNYFAAIHASHERSRAAGARHPEVDVVEIWSSVLTDLVSRHLLAGDISTDVLLTLALEYELLQNPVWLMPGALETLSALTRHQLLIGVVSNAQFYTPLIMEALSHCSLPELGFALDCCFWSYEHGEAKPSPLLWEKAIAELDAQHNIPASQILTVGNDATNDVAVPRALGCLSALFAGDVQSLRLGTVDADTVPTFVLTNLTQIPSLIKRD